jgi:23S rRNA-/tRNA-specific pseudouridylate synthase
MRLEPPCLNILPEIIFQNNDLLVINKPPNLVVHMGGGYFYNTLLGLVKHELKIKEECNGMK